MIAFMIRRRFSAGGFVMVRVLLTRRSKAEDYGVFVAGDAILVITIH